MIIQWYLLHDILFNIVIINLASIKVASSQNKRASTNFKTKFTENHRCFTPTMHQPKHHHPFLPPFNQATQSLYTTNPYNHLYMTKTSIIYLPNKSANAAPFPTYLCNKDCHQTPIPNNHPTIFSPIPKNTITHTKPHNYPPIQPPITACMWLWVHNKTTKNVPRYWSEQGTQWTIQETFGLQGWVIGEFVGRGGR